MKVTLIDHTADPVAKIGAMAGICYDSDTSRDASVRRAAKCRDSGHLATLRFAYATFNVSGISRVCSHQIVRMAHAGILQRSQRYTLSSKTGRGRLEFVPIDGEKYRSNHRFTIPEYEWVKDKYLAGYSMSEIADAMATDTGSISRILTRLRVSARHDESEAKGTNIGFFDDLTNPLAVQLLGFLCADGSVTNNQITVEQAEENYVYLAMLMNLLRPNGNILDCKVGDGVDVQNTYRVYVTSKHIADRLKCLGMTERKGLSFDPTKALLAIKPELHKWFWRGMMDGDGHISLIDKKGQDVVNMAGTKETCEAFLEFTRSCGVETKASVFQKGNSFAVSIGGIKQATAIVNTLYSFQTPLVFPKKAYRAALISDGIYEHYVESLNNAAAYEAVVIPPAFAKVPTYASHFIRLANKANSLYSSLVSSGQMKKEDARYILPQGCTTEMNLCLNFQGWRDFLRNRNDKHAQWEVRNVAAEIDRQLGEIAPELFGNGQSAT